jgi:hypothetical protein
MSTRFVSYDRPVVAAATMVGSSFPFTRWAASMRHKPLGAHQSLLVYTYSFEVGPAALRWLLAPCVEWVFARQTHKRFGRLRAFLATSAADVERWQREQNIPGVADVAETTLS